MASKRTAKSGRKKTDQIASYPHNRATLGCCVPSNDGDETRPPVSPAHDDAPPVLGKRHCEARSNPGDIVETYWPEQFASPRTALCMVAACVALAAIVFNTAWLGGFAAMKISLAERLGLMSPETVSAANFDVAAVLWGIGTIAFLGVIHPCLGLSLLLLLRPWLDGYTFFADNVYFTWSIYLLLALWLIRLIKRRDRMLTPPPVLILGALMSVIFMITPYSYQFYNTYQYLWLWMGYVTLFLLTINMARDRAAWGVVFTAFLITMGLQAVFSILHFEYLLPHLRKVIQDPAVLQRFFNTDTMTPELARRFNVNRAFGTMLFPNALAAYLLLGIPITLVALVPWWRNVGKTLKRPRTTASSTMTATDRAILVAIAIVVGIACFVAILSVTHFPREYRDTEASMPLYLQTTPLTVFAFIFACCIALGVILLLTRYGLDGFWYLCRFGGALALAPILLYTLWITYSRGAYLGLFFAGLLGALLLAVTRDQLQRMLSFASNSAKVARALLLVSVVIVITVFVAELGGASSHAQGAEDTPQAQPAATPAPQSQVRQEGLTLTASDLADPASLRLRFGYWRVTLRMARGNLLTGVGPGNFAIAYPAYQYIGADDVREAHNGFFQMFAETGLFGGLLFAVFWAYFGLWGAWRIVREENRNEKFLLLGLYTGIVAFCLHAFLDINFSHPSLVMFAMVCSGLFYARVLIAESSPAASAQNETGQKTGESDCFVSRNGSFTEQTYAPRLGTPHSGAARNHRIAAMALIVLLVVCTGAAFRVYAQQLTLSRFSFLSISNDVERNPELSRRMRAGQFFIPELTQHGNAMRRDEKPPKNPQILMEQARLFLDDFESIAESCIFYKRSPELRTRFIRIKSDEPIPYDGLMVVARQPFLLRNHALENISNWIEELIRLDGWFPHNHGLALNILKWYEMHVYNIYGQRFAEKRSEWIAEHLKWSGILARRNPYHADARMFYAQALLWNVLHNPDVDADELARRALAQWEEIIKLTPIIPKHRYACAEALTALGNYYTEKGNDALADRLKKEAETQRREAQNIQRRRFTARR